MKVSVTDHTQKKEKQSENHHHCWFSFLYPKRLDRYASLEKCQ